MARDLGGVHELEPAQAGEPRQTIEARPAKAPVDHRVVLGAIDDLVEGARPRRPIGIFGHSNGGAAAAVATRRHPEIRAGVNLDGFIPPS